MEKVELIEAERVGYQDAVELRYFVYYSIKVASGEVLYFRNAFNDRDMARHFLRAVMRMDTVKDFGVTAEYGVTADEFLTCDGKPTPYGYKEM